MSSFTLDDMIRLCEYGHYHQRDKAGHKYITHPMRVLAAVQEQGAQPFVQMAAVGHDLTEDFKHTRITIDMLRTFGVPEAAVEIIRLCDRNLSTFSFNATAEARQWLDDRTINPYEVQEYKDARDAFYYAEIRKNPGAVQVKLADIGDNTQPWRLNYLPPATQDRLRAKYAKAITLLEN